MRALTVAGAILVAGTASATSIEEFLALPPGQPRAVEDLGPGAPFVIDGGMHEGHRSLRWPEFELKNTVPTYALTYHVCVEEEAHPGMVEVWPREGGAGIGMTRPTGCNFYSGGFLDVRIDGSSIGPYRAKIERLTYPTASAYRFTWNTPAAEVQLVFVGRDGDDKMLVHGEVTPGDQFSSDIEVRVKCFPSSFREPRDRWTATADRELRHGMKALLGPTEYWAFFMDRHFDEAMLPDESRGPCALLFNPRQMRRAMVDVGSYGINTRLELMPAQTSFDLALWEFADEGNDAALVRLREAVAEVEVSDLQVEVVEAALRVLASEGNPAATLVLPGEPTVREETAARDLQTYLQQMSGAYLPIVRGEMPEKGNRVLIGAVFGQTYPDVAAGMAGFTLKTEGRDILIRGEDDFGTLYGACELLEKLGVRWFLPGRLGEVVPKMPDVVVPELDETQRPDFAMRWVGRDDWSYRNKCNGRADGVGLGFNVQPGIYHSQYRFMSTRQYFEDHPDWFALIKGRRCGERDAKPCTANPEVIKQTAANMAALLDADPTVGMVSLSYTDGSYYCECPNCTALDEPDVPRDQSMSRRTLIFYNAVAEELVKTHPNARILAGAYHVYNRPPKDPNLKAHPALSLVLCHYTTYCNLHPVNDSSCPPNVAYAKLLADWQRLIPDVYFYEYYHSGGSWYWPCQLIHAIRTDIPYFRKIGCKGLFTQYGAIWDNFLNYYIAGKLLWDADVDVDALLAELYEKFFGPAREPMARYYTTIIRTLGDTDAHACTCSFGRKGRGIFSDKLLTELRGLLEEGKRLAADDRLVAARFRKVEASQEWSERFARYFDLRQAALALPPSEERHKSAVRALEHIEALHDEVTRDRRKWNGVAPSGTGGDTRPWRSVLSQARKLAEPPPAPVGKKLRDLPLKWKFALDNDDIGVKQGWFAADFDDSGWTEVNVGQYWEDQGYKDYDGLAWYRLAVTITGADLAEPLLLGFEGVDAEAWVYLNGHQIGHHDGWDEPFAVKVPKDKLKRGVENMIAVRVRDGSAKGGIYGKVTLARPR